VVGQIEHSRKTGTRIAETRKPKARYVAPFHAKMILFMNWLLCDEAADWVTGKMLNLPATL
jgi:hypothetical protein